MKLNKRTGLVIASAIFVVVGICLYMGYSERVDEQNQLKEQLAQVQTDLRRVQLETLSARQAVLSTNLSQATSELEVVKAKLSQPVGSINASSMLFDVAKTYGLVVTEMTSPGPVSDSLEGVTYSVLSLTARVEGDVPSLISFVTELNSLFTTGIVKSTTITVPGTSPETDNETNNEGKPSVDIQLVVYTYGGD